ncbi:MAG TPA: NAD(P)/FAD-dependent oxidoreductase [Rhizomicrobium sp.]|nr:NAD(P)/FAD-dependent oxidoreductase [Rhizomicrobium sp.]
MSFARAAMFDAAVIGAGPAGSSTALLLARAGWQVALVEKSVFPRRKVCGEFISSASLPVLQACGVAKDFLAMAGPVVTRIGLYAGGAMLASPREKEWGRALGREHLDTMLRDAATSAGAKLFQPAQVASVRRSNGKSVCALQTGEEIAARIVVAACGSWNAKSAFSIPSHTDAPSDLFAFKAHFRGDGLPPGLMPLLAFPGGYGGLVRSDNGRLSLSCCVRRDALATARERHGGKAAEAVIAHIRATTKGVDQALALAEPDGHFLSTGPIHPGIRPRYRDGVFFVGNIAGEAHPIIAEGISMAIQSGALLARLLIAGRADAYHAAWNGKFGLRLRAASLFAHLAMRNPTRVLARATIARFPGVLDWGAQLSGKV